MNKKIIVPFLSAVTGISMAAGIGGAFAWYQYNSQVTASFVGSSVADTTLLQIGHKNGDEMEWGRDFYAYGDIAQKLVPVTFGKLVTANNQAVSPSNPADALRNAGATAYGYPEAGKQAGNTYSDWTSVAANNGYAQFEIYLRALKADKSPVSLDVYLTDITIEGIVNNTTSEAAANKSVTDALRIHLNVENAGNRLISKNAIVEDPDATPDPYLGLPLHGYLDLDGVGGNDTTGGYSWNQSTSPITYGVTGEYQTTLGAVSTLTKENNESDEDYEARVKADPNVLKVYRNADGTITENTSKKICSTKNTNTSTDADYVKIVVTVWLEGWALLKTGATTESNVWDPAYSAGIDVRVGLTFDTGKVRVQ